jgi:hypothetical protein
MTELIVLISETASAPPFWAALPGGTILVTFGVSLTITGRLETSLTHSVTMQCIRDLAHRGAHAAFAHAVRAAKIELKSIAACILRPFDDLMPSLAFGLDHERDNDSMARIFLLTLVNLFKIYIERPVGYQFNSCSARSSALLHDRWMQDAKKH